MLFAAAAAPDGVGEGVGGCFVALRHVVLYVTMGSGCVCSSLGLLLPFRRLIIIFNLKNKKKTIFSKGFPPPPPRLVLLPPPLPPLLHFQFYI